MKILWVSFAPSDTLGLSSLVDLMNHSDVESVATESTILGPFYVPDSPMREFGESMVETPLAGALLDVWQNAATGFYAVQQPDVRGRVGIRGEPRTSMSRFPPTGTRRSPPTCSTAPATISTPMPAITESTRP